MKKQRLKRQTQRLLSLLGLGIFNLKRLYPGESRRRVIETRRSILKKLSSRMNHDMRSMEFHS